eukprot:225402-Amphidinium_carterae.2
MADNPECVPQFYENDICCGHTATLARQCFTSVADWLKNKARLHVRDAQPNDPNDFFDVAACEHSRICACMVAQHKLQNELAKQIRTTSSSSTAEPPERVNPPTQSVDYSLLE